MRFSKHIVFAALLAAASIGSTSHSYADVQPSPTPAASMAEYKIALERYKAELKLFKAIEREYKEKCQHINEQFKDAIEKALGKARAGSSRSQSQKLDEVKAKRSAGLSAAIARDEAIRALGDPPKPPTPPAKPIRSKKSSNKVNR